VKVLALQFVLEITELVEIKCELPVDSPPHFESPLLAVLTRRVSFVEYRECRGLSLAGR
jgi:hypothetical protein